MIAAKARDRADRIAAIAGRFVGRLCPAGPRHRPEHRPQGPRLAESAANFPVPVVRVVTARPAIFVVRRGAMVRRATGAARATARVATGRAPAAVPRNAGRMRVLITPPRFIRRTRVSTPSSRPSGKHAGRWSYSKSPVPLSRRTIALSSSSRTSRPEVASRIAAVARSRVHRGPPMARPAPPRKRR